MGSESQVELLGDVDVLENGKKLQFRFQETLAFQAQCIEAKMDQKLIRIAGCTQLYCPIKMEHSHLMAHFSLSNRAPVSAFTKAPPSPDPPKKPVDLMASKKYQKWLDLLRGSTSQWCIQRSVCPGPAH